MGRRLLRTCREDTSRLGQLCREWLARRPGASQIDHLQLISDQDGNSGSGETASVELWVNCGNTVAVPPFTNTSGLRSHPTHLSLFPTHPRPTVDLTIRDSASPGS